LEQFLVGVEQVLGRLVGRLGGGLRLGLVQFALGRVHVLGRLVELLGGLLGGVADLLGHLAGRRRDLGLLVAGRAGVVRLGVLRQRLRLVGDALLLLGQFGDLVGRVLQVRHLLPPLLDGRRLLGQFAAGV